MSVDLKEELAKINIFLPEEVLVRQKFFLDELLRWNKRVNLTAIRNRAEGLEKHLLDSLLMLPYLDGCSSLLDMGSGAGLPGIPLAIARPELRVVSIDSVGKKINFQKHIKRELQLTNLSARTGRLEELGGDFVYDAVVARALASLEDLMGFGLDLIGPTGRLIAMKGPEGESEWQEVKTSRIAQAYELVDIARYSLPNSRSERQLLIFKKIQSEQSEIIIQNNESKNWG